MMFDRHANLKYNFGNRHFWSEGYYESTVGLNKATIKKYIQDQEKAVLCGIKCASCPTCNQTCRDFEKERCVRLDRALYVCNGFTKNQSLHDCPQILL